MRGRSLARVKEPKILRKECGMAGDIFPSWHQTCLGLPFSALFHIMPPRTRLVPCTRCRGRDPFMYRKIKPGQSLTAYLERHLKCDSEHPCTNCRTLQISCQKVSHKKIRFRHVFAHNRSISTPNTGGKGISEACHNSQSIFLIWEYEPAEQ